MSSVEWRARGAEQTGAAARAGNTVRRPAEVVLTLGVGATVLAALMPLLRVVTPGWWLLGTAVMVALVLTAGVIARHFRLPALVVTLIEAAVGVAALTLIFARESALLGVIPTPQTLRTVPLLFDIAREQVVQGSAPLAAGAPLAFVIVGAVGLLTIIIDHVVVTTRMPLLAGLGLIAISLIPAIAVPSDVDLTSFVLLAAGILFLIRVETRTREYLRAPRPQTSSGLSALAAGIGVIALVVVVAVTPLLPQPSAQAGSGIGVPGASINPSLELGDDLRQPRDTEVLRVSSDAPSTPYLRAVTLSQFTGRVWLPDTGRTVPLDADLSLGTVDVAPDVRVTEYTTSVDVVGLSSPWLPVAFPAVSVDGLEGAWNALPYNRTVLSDTANATDQQYEIVTHLPRPSLEQIRASQATAADVRDSSLDLPNNMSDVIGETAAEVTASATTDYDALLALQRWFRGPDFEYSLEAPVDEGFDGSGIQALEQFLDVKRGYCVHFASAFALMARTLDMPSRIVVGYLPGTSTGDQVEGSTVYSVSSSQLHSWPEVFFEGIGWVPFEPTSSLGTPTSFAPSTVPQPEGGTEVVPSAAPSAEPAPSASIAPEVVPDDAQGGPTGGTAAPVNVLPAVGIALGVLLVLAVPALLRLWRRRVRVAAAQGGDAAAAWRELQDLALDLGIEVRASQTPRSLGMHLVANQGASVGAVDELVRGIERASYAPGGRREVAHGPTMATALESVRGELMGHKSAPRRLLALLGPRSLVIRPGSVYAGQSGAPASAR